MINNDVMFFPGQSLLMMIGWSVKDTWKLLLKRKTNGELIIHYQGLYSSRVILILVK